MKKSVKIVIIILIIGMFVSNIVYAENRQKGDINGDNKLTVLDNSILKLHLTKMTSISDENLIYADMNEDGKITVVDLSKIKLLLVGLNVEIGKEIDVNSEEIKMLYDYIPILDDMRSENFSDAYSSNKTVVSNINNKLLLNMGLINMLVTEEKESVNKEEIGLSLTDGFNLFAFTSDNLEKNIKRIYGNEVIVKHESFNTQKALLDASCKYNESNKSYTCYWTGLSGEYVNEIRKLNTAIKENNEIYLYDRYIYTETSQNEQGTNIIKVYSNSDKNNLLKTIETDKSFTDEELYNMFTDLIKMYKHTFKQAENGSYYWYSSEMVE